jgi:hypothetical protein
MLLCVVMHGEDTVSIKTATKVITLRELIIGSYTIIIIIQFGVGSRLIIFLCV